MVHKALGCIILSVIICRASMKNNMYAPVCRVWWGRWVSLATVATIVEFLFVKSGTYRQLTFYHNNNMPSCDSYQ